MQSAYRIYPVIALGLLAAGSIWLERLTRAPDTTQAQAQPGVPDFLASQTRIVGYGKDGARRYVLLADELIHHPLTDITELQRPRLQILSSDMRTMTITSNAGTASARGEQVEFSGDVVANREARAGAENLHFTSNQLMVWPEEHRAESTSPVKLNQGLTTATALGLRANDLFGTLALIGQAHVTIPRRNGKKK